MVTIRPGTIEDVDKAIPVIQAFHHEALAGFGFLGDEDRLIEIARASVDNSFVAVEGEKIVGLIAGAIVKSVSDNDLAFHELIWYMLPGYRQYGMRLYKEMESACKEGGIKRIIMVAMSNETGQRVGRIYNGMGYRELERHFVKELK